MIVYYISLNRCHWKINDPDHELQLCRWMYSDVLHTNDILSQLSQYNWLFWATWVLQNLSFQSARWSVGWSIKSRQLASNNFFQGRRQVWVLVLESGLLSPLWYDLLPLGEDHGPLWAQCCIHNKPWHWENGRPLHEPAQLFSELVVGVERWSDAVKDLRWGGSSVSRLLQGVGNDSCQVWHMDPRKRLTPRSQCAPQAEPERQEHLLHGTTILAQHCP